MEAINNINIIAVVDTRTHNLLNKLHPLIPIDNPEELILSLSSAHAAREEYLNAWRLGFDIMVNLALAAERERKQQ